MPADFFELPRGFYEHGGLRVPVIGTTIAVIGTLVTNRAMIEEIGGFDEVDITEAEAIVLVPEAVFAAAARQYVAEHGMG